MILLKDHTAVSACFTTNHKYFSGLDIKLFQPVVGQVDEMPDSQTYLSEMEKIDLLKNKENQQGFKQLL